MYELLINYISYLSSFFVTLNHIPVKETNDYNNTAQKHEIESVSSSSIDSRVSKLVTHNDALNMFVHLRVPSSCRSSLSLRNDLNRNFQTHSTSPFTSFQTSLDIDRLIEIALINDDEIETQVIHAVLWDEEKYRITTFANCRAFLNILYID